jgi:hypothetical protein
MEWECLFCKKSLSEKEMFVHLDTCSSNRIECTICENVCQEGIHSPDCPHFTWEELEEFKNNVAEKRK